MQAPSLRPRAFQLIVQDLQVDALDVDFSATLSLKAQQNKAEIKIYNLSKEHRLHLAQVSGGVAVDLRAGYATGLGADLGDPFSTAQTPRLLLGKLRIVTNLRSGPDWVTTVTTGDGDDADRPIKFSLGKGATLESTVKQVVSELGVGVGNVLQAIKQRGFKDGLGQIFANGVTVQGGGAKELERLLRSAGLEMSIQNGEIQALELGKPLTTEAVDVTVETGLVGSPELGRDSDGATIKARVFLNSDVRPGRQVRVRSESIDARFRVETVTHQGQTYGTEWYTDFLGRPFK